MSGGRSGGWGVGGEEVGGGGGGGRCCDDKMLQHCDFIFTGGSTEGLAKWLAN